MNSGSTPAPQRDLVHDLVFPTLLFCALGAMTWAVRGCAGAGGMNAHVAPGLTWGTAWWFLARGPAGSTTRRYHSGWILFALAAGFAIAGERGWMQWPNFFSGQLATNYGKGEYVPISRGYGFLWFFLAGTAWAGLPACFLAWCGDTRPLRAWEWLVRLGCGFGGGYLAWRLYVANPQIFLPLYDTIQDKYHDFRANPNLAKLYRDNGATLRHLGFCAGFLLFEAGRKDWRNIKLILTVGLITGLGWAACQNWRWAAGVWPKAEFNFGRCWEVSGGIVIGLGLGLAYYWVNRRQVSEDPSAPEFTAPSGQVRGEWLVAAGILMLLGASQFWPTARDMRLASARPSDAPQYLWGSICLVVGLASIGMGCVGRLADAAPGYWCRIQLAIEALLFLAFGWFIKTQMGSEYGDGPNEPAWSGWFSPGNALFGVVLAYVAYRLTLFLQPQNLPDGTAAPVHAPDPAVDGLFNYLWLTIIVMWCLSVGLGSAWGAPLWFGCVGATFGLVYFISLFRQAGLGRPTVQTGSAGGAGAIMQDWGIGVGLIYGLGLSLRKALKGGANLYVGDENGWDTFFWNRVSAGMLLVLVAGAVILLRRFLRHGADRAIRRRVAGVFWLVLVAQNLLAQIVTGPVVGARASWMEAAFSIFYLILFLLTVVLAFHYQSWWELLKTGQEKLSTGSRRN